MDDFRDTLNDAKVIPSNIKKIPTEDGKYQLPDRRILFRKGDQLTVVGHRDKKRQRQLARCSQESLEKLLSYPGFGSFTQEQLAKMTKDDMMRTLNPRPEQTFHISWLITSQCPEARELKKIIRKAEKL